MRFLIHSGCIFLSVLLLACRATPQDQYPLFAGWSGDSIRHELESRTWTGREEMIASGMLGVHYNVTGKYDSARIWLNRALSLPGGREFEGGRFIANLANSYGFQGRYAEALKYYMEALQESERPATSERDRALKEFNIIRVMANLAEIHYFIGNPKQALYCAEQARERTESASYITPQYMYIIGAVHLDAGELDEAQSAMQQTYEVAYSMTDGGEDNSGGLFWYTAYGKEGLARVALARKDYAGALGYAAEALDYAQRHGDPTVTAKMLAALSDIHIAQGDHEEGEKYARQALEAYPDYPKLNPGVLFNIASARLLAGAREEALGYFRLYSAGMKENTDRQFHETMAGMEVVHETEKKETRIAALEQQKILYVTIGIAGFLLAATICILLFQKIGNERKERQLAAANAILEWEKKERKRFASDLHDGINGMLSAMKLELGTVEPLQSIRNQIDGCIETIRRMSRGMMPSSLERYGLKAALEDYCRLFPNVDFYFFGEDRRIGERLELTVYYCAYELINNAFRHSGAENIHVQLVQDGGSVSLTVQDDGCGFDEHSAVEGSGLKNIRDRVASFNGKIDIAASVGEGTEINIELNTENA